MIKALKVTNRKPKRLLPVVLSVLIVSMCFSQIIPQTAEAAKKKPAVKSVVLKVNGKKVTKKTIKVNRGSKVKVSVIVNPTKAKKSVKWSKLSAKQKKIAVMKGNTITAKKNGTIKLTVKVKGKNGKTKSAWMKVKVVTPSKKKPATTTKPSTSTTKPSTTTPSKPSTSTPSTSNPSTPSTTKTYSVRMDSLRGKFWTGSYSTGTMNLTESKYIPTDNSDPSYEFVGWYTGVNGTGTKVTSITASNAASIANGTKIQLYAHWKQKDASKWVFQNSSGSGDLVNKGEAYEADGIRSYSELSLSESVPAKLRFQCSSCGKDISFNVNAGGKVITVTQILRVNSHYYALSKSVEESGAVSADWRFIEVTTAANSLTYHTPCHVNLYSGLISGSRSINIRD